MTNEPESNSGARSLTMPGKNAGPQEIAAFHEALGTPKSHDGYAVAKFEPPEGLPWNGDLLPKLLPKMHKLGISDAQASGIVEAYAAAQHESYRTGMAKGEQSRAQANQQLRREWGNAYGANLGAAEKAFRTLAGKDSDAIAGIRLEDGSALGDHPAILRLFASIADNHTRPTMTRGDATEELAKLENDPSTRKILLDRMHPEHDALMQRRSALHKAKVARG